MSKWNVNNDIWRSNIRGREVIIVESVGTYNVIDSLDNILYRGTSLNNAIMWVENNL